MKTTSHIHRFVLLFAVLVLSMLAVAPIQAAPIQAAPATTFGPGHTFDQCPDRKFIPFWGSRRFIEAQGFNFDIIGDQASVKFRNHLSLDLASNPASSAYT